MIETIGLVIITGYNAWRIADSLFTICVNYNRFILACQVKF